MYVSMNLPGKKSGAVMVLLSFLWVILDKEDCSDWGIVIQMYFSIVAKTNKGF